MSRYSLKSFIGQTVTVGLILLLFPGGALRAQTPGPAPAQGTPQQMLSPDQLDDLVAPIALYPDQLLSQVLVACTYPLEIVEAQQWLQRNNNLKGTQLMDAARQQNWDASVQALVAFPDVLGRLNQDVRWTTDLGNAFLAQQADVMSAVQRMRARAQANGRLSSSAQQTVTTETQGGQSAIEIQPANPDVIYVPYYDPMYVWGPPAWGYYPSLYYPAFGFGFWPGINIGFCFGGWGGWGFGGWGWGWGWPAWGWGWGWDPWLWGYGYPYYDSYPVYEDAPDPGVAPPAPPAPSYWYYCPSSKAYYPYVQDCSEPWVPVTPGQ